MTEPDGDDVEAGEIESEDAESQLDAALGRFKPRDPDADTSPVSENGRSGLRWSPVTETGTERERPAEAPPRSSFQFDLGSALARLGSVAEPRVDEPVSEPSDDPLPVRGRESDPGVVSEPEAPVDPLPVRGRESGSGPGSGSDAPVDPLPVRGRESDPGVVSEPEAPVDPLPVRSREPDADPASQPDEPVDPLPVRARQSAPKPAADPLPTRTPPAQGPDPAPRPVVDRLPTRTPRPAPTAPPSPAADERAEPPPAARSSSAGSPSRSVFDDANPTPILPRTATPRTEAGQAPAATPAPPAGDSPFLPTLPASMPASPPSVAAPIESAPSTPELNALRSAQLRASRNDRQGKLLGRAFLGLVLVGGLVAAALLFGRSYLFPTEWDPELTPLVDEIQSERGVEFDDTAPLVERPATEYAPLVTAHVLGSDWNARLPEWRALGLAGGDGAVDDVQERIASLYPAYYDADAGEIVASLERSADARTAALRLALEDALAIQAGAERTTPAPLGLTGLDPIDAATRRAFDAAAADLLASAPDATADLSGVPLPVAYQLRAIDSIGSTLLDGDGAARPGDPLPAVAARLDDEAARGVGGLLQPGDQQILDPVALGTDDWALIWGARLSPAVVGQMVDALRTDSYTVVNRSGATCFVAVFQTTGDAATAALVADLGIWATGAPSGAQAAVAQLGPDRVQLEGCDPGADAALVPAVSAVDVVIARQLDRLAAD